MANYAIGDIQGCFDSLQALLEKIKFSEQSDTLWIAGDLVNRGPKSLETLRFLKQLEHERCKVVLGNHDLHLLAVAYGGLNVKHKDTLSEILDAADSAELLEWLNKQCLVHLVSCENKRFLISHAGLAPNFSFEQAKALSQELEDVLNSNQGHLFYQNMYGNLPDQWSDGLEGQDRLRLITNYFTRMRFCTQNAQLELTHKGLPSDEPDGFKPWFQFENTKLQENDHIVFGHWAALEGITNKPKVHAIDTGCVWGRSLSALRLEDTQRFSVPAQE